MKISIHKNSIFIVLIFLCFSCGGEYLEDPLDPRYIMYTESGKGAAGASINGEPWKSVVMPGIFFGGSDYPKLYSYPQNDSIVIIFEGAMDNSYLYTTIEFRINGIKIENEADVFKLRGTKFLLDGWNRTGLVNSDDDRIELPAIYGSEYSGQIYFRSITKENFSGTFYIKMGDYLQVSYGRFDYAFNNLEINID